jgi:ubiquinone/menaquinone biosynthesis C-methylase UbiE
MPSLPDATLKTLRDYFSPMWADMIADRTDEIGTGMIDFLSRIDRREGVKPVTLPAVEGEVAEISYTVRGSGPPLVLFPLALAPSQWQPLVALLSERYCTITIGGPALGMVGFLEARGHGYLRVVRSLVDEAHLRPGETVLEVGCGAGTIARWLARHTNGMNRIVGVDINQYLLREAAALAGKEGIGGLIEFRDGNAEALPFTDSRFDVTMACTVLEEGDADRMLAEMVRVTKPGGRVAVIVRSIDMPGWVNLPLRAELKARVEAQTGTAQENGCADAHIYMRFHQAGLEQVAMLPQLASFWEGARLEYMEERILDTLKPEEVNDWQEAAAQAKADGSFFISQPFHCAVGTKP